MRNKSAILGSILLTLAAAMPWQASVAATPKVDATIEFKAEQIRVIFGGGKGAGVLHFKGQDYPFTIKALSVGGIGVSKVDGVGTVENLTSVEDFAGKYIGVGAGAVVVKGKGVSKFKSDKGVIVTTKAKGSGAALNLGAGGIIVELGN